MALLSGGLGYYLGHRLAVAKFRETLLNLEDPQGYVRSVAQIHVARAARRGMWVKGFLWTYGLPQLSSEYRSEADGDFMMDSPDDVLAEVGLL